VSRMSRFNVIAAAMFAATAVWAEAIDWEKVPDVSKGVKIHNIALEKPRLIKGYMLRIDLNARQWRYTQTGRDAKFGERMPEQPTNENWLIATKLETTKRFMDASRKRGENMVVALNATPWEPFRSGYHYAQPLGVNISDGALLTTNEPTGAVFAVDKKGRYTICRNIPLKDASKYAFAASAFQMILENGRDQTGPKSAIPYQGPRDNEVHPRMAFGLSKDRRYFYALAIDGRQKEWSIGASCREMVPMLQDAGAWDAVNMDGGGSTTMLYYDEKQGKPVMVNRHDAKRRRTRSDALNVGFIAVDEKK